VCLNFNWKTADQSPPFFPYDTHTQSLVSCIISARVKRISVLAEIDLKIPPDGELEGI
jgi:hypothetical protein